jgi:2,3-bisphosphoglycerate-independent phosphoglycerate mutase
MKYIILIGDGMSDYPLEEKGGQTPLQISRTPSMDLLAQKGDLGLVKTIPEGMGPGSDVANLSVLGYDPGRFYTGRAPIEAASIGVKLSEQDVAFRCNLVTLVQRDGGLYMDDYSAGHISTEDAALIVNALKEKFDSEEITFYPGVSYRHLMVWKQGECGMITFPPHDISGRKIDPYLPRGQGAAKILKLMELSRDILPSLESNTEKKNRGEKPANAIWLWGQGRSLKVPEFSSKYGLSGSVVSAVDLIKGLGISAGLTPIFVPGATGYLDTNYEGKVYAALNALETVDFVYLHVEAPDEASHKGSFKEKLQAIEDFDKNVVTPVMEGLAGNFGQYRLMVLPDHSTPLSIMTHASDPVPFVIYSSQDLGKKARKQIGYNEQDAKETGLYIANGWELMDRFIGE